MTKKRKTVDKKMTKYKEQKIIEKIFSFILKFLPTLEKSRNKKITIIK